MWFESYPSNRMQYCSIDGHDSQHKVNPPRIPQGLFLGPILFLVYINYLSWAPENSETSSFADANLTCIAKMTSEAQRKVNDDLLVLGKWLSANKLSENVVKTSYMILATFHKLQALDFSPWNKLKIQSRQSPRRTILDL